MKTKSPFHKSKKLLIAGMLAVSAHCIAQNPSVKVFEDWNTTSGTQNSFQRTVVRSKAFGGAVYYYLCGATLNSSGNYDMLVQKKNSAGTVLWSQTYAGAGGGHDYATDVQIDAVGNVYVCGTYYKDATDSNNAIVIKYNTVGTHKWTNTYNGTGSRHDGASQLAVRTSEVYVVGTTWHGTTRKYDMLAIRYDSTGSLIWTQNWDYSSLFDVATNVNFTSKGLVIAGGAQSAIATYKYATVRLAYSDGSVATFSVSSGTGFGFDQVTDLQTDVTGNVYITGGSFDVTAGYNIRTVKMDTSLNIVWQANYDGGSSLNDMGTGLQLDQVGNVIVTGYRTSSTSGKDYVTIKYSSGGTQRWVSTFDGGINEDDSATSIVVNPTDTNKIYVTGYSYNDSTKDYWTMKYDGLGNQKWSIGFNNLYNTNDRATAIALDTLGNVIVAGQNTIAWNNHTYTTVKYIEKSMTYPDDTITTTPVVAFTKNNGQLLDTDGDPRPEIRYYTLNTSPAVYFMDTAVSYVFADKDTASANDSLVRVDQKFVGANSNLRVYSTDERSDYCNFYLGHIPEGREQVHNYNTLVSFNVWNSVDVLYSSNARGLKTYYICKPLGGGGSATQIHLKFYGADSVRINGSGELVIYTKLGTLVQPKPSAWQLDANGNYQSLGWQPSYNLIATNEVKFTSFGSFNAALPLVIGVDWGDCFYPSFVVDNLLWSTFEGGTWDDKFNSISAENPNVTFAGGNAKSLNFPNTTGGYQGSNAGTQDGIISRHLNGYSQWRTYYGGSVADDITSVSASHGAYGVYFTGFTYSADFPVGPTNSPYPFTAYSTTSNGPSDAVIGYLDGLGQLTWATCYGSATANESGTIIKAVDNTSSFYVAGKGADGNTPLTSQFGASNLTLGDAFILKYHPSTYVCQWATLYGGTPTSTDHTIIADLELVTGSTNHLVIAGSVTGGLNDLPSATNGAPGGSSDAFVATFDANDVLNWSTYYGGGSGEGAKGVAVNSVGEIFIAGSTKSTSLTCPNPNFEWNDYTYDGGVLAGDGFVAEFDPNGALYWASYLGGADDEDANDVVIDDQDNVYIVGRSRSNTFPGWPQPTNPAGVWGHPLHGETNAFIFQIDRWHGRAWTTYFGGQNDEIANCAYIHKDLSNSTSYLYIVGQTTSCTSPISDPFPLVGTGVFSSATLQTQGVNLNNYQYSNGNNYDGFIASFDLAPAITSTETTAVENEEFGIFPNPNSGGFTLEVSTDPNEEFTIVIYDVLGQVAYTQNAVSGSGIFRSQIVLEDAASGVYMVQLQFSDHVVTKQTIIQK